MSRPCSAARVPPGRLAATLAALLAAGVLLASAPAMAEDGRAPSPAALKTAESHFRRGVGLYKDGDYGGALVEFRRAYDSAPNYRVLYNVAQSLYQLQRYAEALTTMQDYLAKGGAHIPASRRASVDEDIKTLRARVAHVTVTVSEDGADVFVDEERIGTSPLKDPVLVSVGRRKVSASKAGRPPVEKLVDVAAGDSATVSLDLPPPVLAPPPADARASQPPPSAQPAAAAAPARDTTPAHDATATPGAFSRPDLWIPWTVTGVLAAGTAVTGVLALTSQSQLSNQLGVFPGDANAINNDRSQAKAFALASDVLLGVTAVSLGVSLWWTLTPASTSGAERTAGGARPTRVLVGPGFAAVAGEY